MKLLPPPGPERRRQLTRLLLLAVLLAAVLLFWRTPTGRPPSASNSAGRGAAASASGQLPVPEALKLDALESVDPLADAVRNPFVFGERYAPSAPGSSFVTTPQPWSPPPVANAPPPAPQGPPPITLRLTGMTVPVEGGRTLVTLKDSATGALYQAYEGDIVDGRYRVVKVGVQSVVVAYLDGSGMRTIPLGS